jgi:hypothetical protein
VKGQLTEGQQIFNIKFRWLKSIELRVTSTKKVAKVAFSPIMSVFVQLTVQSVERTP